MNFQRKFQHLVVSALTGAFGTVGAEPTVQEAVNFIENLQHCDVYQRGQGVHDVGWSSDSGPTTGPGGKDELWFTTDDAPGHRLRYGFSLSNIRQAERSSGDGGLLTLTCDVGECIAMVPHGDYHNVERMHSINFFCTSDMTPRIHKALIFYISQSRPKGSF